MSRLSRAAQGSAYLLTHRSWTSRIGTGFRKWSFSRPRGRDAQWRPARLETDRLREAAKWMERYRIFWEKSFDRLDAHLRELQQEEQKHGRRK